MPVLSSHGGMCDNCRMPGEMQISMGNGRRIRYEGLPQMNQVKKEF